MYPVFNVDQYNQHVLLTRDISVASEEVKYGNHELMFARGWCNLMQS